jgi:hypothetical protein
MYLPLFPLFPRWLFLLHHKQVSLVTRLPPTSITHNQSHYLLRMVAVFPLCFPSQTLWLPPPPPPIEQAAINHAYADITYSLRWITLNGEFRITRPLSFFINFLSSLHSLETGIFNSEYMHICNTNENRTRQVRRTYRSSGVYRRVPSDLQPPYPKCFKKLKNYFKHMLYFNGTLCLFRICVQRQAVLRHSINEMQISTYCVLSVILR